MGERRSTYMVLVGKHEEKNHLEDTGIDGGTTLIWIFKKWVWGAWTGLIWLRIRTADVLL